MIRKRIFINSISRSFIIFTLLLLIYPIDSSFALPTTGKWDVFEINLTTNNTYKNPFKEVSLQATFSSPTGHTIKVNGFYDGENNWKIRFVPDEVGLWTAVTASSDPELNNIDILLKSTDKGLHDFLRADPEHPYSLYFEDGGLHFLPIGDSSNRFFMDQNNKAAPSNWKQYFDEMASDIKANHLYSGIIENPSWHLNGYYSWPFGGSAKNPDFDRYNLDQWRYFDQVIDYAESKGIVISVILMGWTTVPKGYDNTMTHEQKYAFYRYAMSRLAHHKNVIWVLYWDIPPNQDFVRDEGNYVKSVDPYKHLLTSHQARDTGFSYASENWADIITLETLDELDGNDIKNWREYNKPVIIAEDRYSWWLWPDNSPYFFRRLLWASILSGGSATWGETEGEYATNADYELFSDPDCNGHGGKRDFKHIYSFFVENNISFWDMKPHDELVSHGAKALGKPGNSYIIYLPNPGVGGPYPSNVSCGGSNHNSIDVDTDVPSVTVNLISFENSKINARWYNPRDGTYPKNETIDGGSSYTFTAPGSKDWVLYIEVVNENQAMNLRSFFKYLLQRLNLIPNSLK